MYFLASRTYDSLSLREIKLFSIYLVCVRLEIGVIEAGNGRASVQPCR